MRKHFPILGAAGVLSVLSLLSVLLMATSFQATAQGNTGTVIGGDEASLRAMLEHVVAATDSSDAGATVYIGALPPDLPFPVMLPKEVRLIGSIAYRNTDPYPRPTQIYFDTSLATRDVIAFFEKNLPKNFERAEMPFMPSAAGFQASDTPEMADFCYNKAEGELGIRAFAQESGSRVILGIGGKEVTKYSRCYQPGPNAPESYRLMPALSAPKGVQIQPSGGGAVSDNTASSAAVLTTDAHSVQDLIGYYQETVKKAGWLVASSFAQTDGGWLTGTMKTGEASWTLHLSITRSPLHANQYSAALLVNKSR